MKTQNNIEEQFEKIKDAYRVPEAYFEQINIPKQKRTKFVNLRGIKTYLTAAMILLLVTLGYQVWNWQQNNSQLPKKTGTELSKNDKIFDDLSDEEIIDYLSKEDITDLIL